MTAKAYKGIGMNGMIARWYANTAEKDCEQYRQLANRLSNLLTGEKDILEVAPGPGHLSVELAKKQRFTVTALDISETFVEIAAARAKENQVTAKFVLGNVSDMPFNAEQYDFVVCRAAFKNFSEPLKAINEMFRVLRPGGQALIIDLRKDISDQEISAYVKKLGLGKRDSLMTSWTFKNMLRKRAYSLEQMKQLSSASRFKNFRIDSAPLGFELWLGK